MVTHHHPIIFDVRGCVSVYIRNVTGGTNVSCYISPVEPQFF